MYLGFVFLGFLSLCFGLANVVYRENEQVCDFVAPARAAARQRRTVQRVGLAFAGVGLVLLVVGLLG